MGPSINQMASISNAGDLGKVSENLPDISRGQWAINLGEIGRFVLCCCNRLLIKCEAAFNKAPAVKQFSHTRC